MPHPLDSVPQTTQDFAALKYLMFQTVIEHQVKTLLEIGTDVGDSTRIWSTALQGTSGRVITVDLVAPKENWPAAWPMKNIEFRTQDSKTLQWNQPIDLLFLDGNHLYEHAKEELTTLGPWVRTGGCILCHDIHHSEFGTGLTKAVTEFAKDRMLCWTNYPHQHGLAIIEVTHALR